jgi:hypothetical protein
VKRTAQKLRLIDLWEIHSGSLQMEALVFVLFAAFILSTIFVLMSQAKKARETYGFGLVVNWSFLLVVLCLFSLLFGSVMASSGQSDQHTNGMVLQFTSLALIGFAGFINVKRSNPKFGVWFTFLQVIAAIGIIVPLFLIFSHFRTKGVMSEMTR